VDSVPAGWKQVKLGHIARIYAGGTPDKRNEAYWADGTIAWINSGSVNQGLVVDPSEYITEAGYHNSSARFVPSGALVMALAGQGRTKGMVAQMGIEATCNQSMAAIVLEEDDPRYVMYWLVANYRNIRGIASDDLRDGLNLQHVSNIPCPRPPVDEQSAIVSYLDVETARIDGLIEDKQSLVATLKEMRRSSVAEAITKGVRGARSMQPSGLSWVASIPADWRTLSLKRFVRLSGGHTPSTGNPAYWDGSVPWFSPKDMKADELLDSIDHVTELAVEESGLHVIEPGTAMIVVRGMILAHTFPVCVTQVKATINQDMKALVPEDGVHQRFLPWLLRGSSALFLSLTEQSAHGTMALRTDRFMGEKLPIPPLAEQIEIVEHLEAERQRIDLLVQQINEEIGLLRELRSATIADAVLGHIDVREYIKS
jgi:type I restriction enzyme S subunit